MTDDRARRTIAARHAWRTWARARTTPATRETLRRVGRQGAAMVRLLLGGVRIADVWWMARALPHHECAARRRSALALTLADAARALVPTLAAWRADDAHGAALARQVLDACRRFDDGSLRRRGERLRTYVDASVQADVLRVLADFLAARPAPPRGGPPAPQPPPPGRL
jgi:hypothetical protein